MDNIILFIQHNPLLAPWVVFGLLILAGFNLPVSEDLLMFISGILASKYPSHSFALFMAMFWGAYLSDLICYAFLGRFLGPKIFKIKFFKKMISQKKIDKIHLFLNKYGVLCLIIGRFIPFGIRNPMFFTAGLTKMNAYKFAIGDFIACLGTTVVFFNLYKTFGESILIYIKKGNIVFSALVLLVVLFLFIKNRKKV